MDVGLLLAVVELLFTLCGGFDWLLAKLMGKSSEFSWCVSCSFLCGSFSTEMRAEFRFLNRTKLCHRFPGAD